MSYSLDFLEILLSPIELTELTHTTFEDYKRYMATDAGRNPEEKYRFLHDSTWGVFAVGTKTISRAFLTKETLSEIDEYNHKSFASDLENMFNKGSKEWKKGISIYTSDTANMLRVSLTLVQPRNPEEVKIKNSFMTKVQWYFFNHGDVHYAPIFPILTPKFLVCLGQVLSMVPRALTEVSMMLRELSISTAIDIIFSSCLGYLRQLPLMPVVLGVQLIHGTFPCLFAVC
jgi:hypothetical protein